MPVPEDVDTPKFKANVGSGKFRAETNHLVWSIGHMTPGREYLMRARMGLPSVRAADTSASLSASAGNNILLLISIIISLDDPRSRAAQSSMAALERKLGRPIQVSFEVPYYTASGLQVRYLKIVEKSGYPALPWVRYLTQNGGI